MTKLVKIIKKNRKLIAASLLFFIFCALVTLIMTWKLGIHMGSYYFSPEIPGDGMGTIASNWYNEYAGKNDLPEPVTNFYAYPFGYDLRGLPVYPLTTELMNQVTRIIGSQAAYNILIFLSFPVGALSVFLLLFYLTRSYGGSVVGGFIYGFSPWHVARAFNHVSLCGIHTLPLFVLAIIVFWKRKDALSALFVTITFIIAAYTDLHFALFSIFLAIMWMAARLLKRGGRKPKNGEEGRTGFRGNPRVRLTLLIFLIIIVSTAAYAPFIKNILYSDPTVFPEQDTRGVEADVDFSSDAWNYVVPPAYSTFWQGYTEDFTISRLGKRTSSEVTAYPGIISVALAVVCLYLIGKKNAITQKYGAKVEDINAPVIAGIQGETLNTAVNFSVLAIVLAFLFSMPPLVNIGSARIPTPSILISAIVPFFRYFCRWSLVVTFGLALLAGIGFTLLSKRLRLDRKSVVFACVIAIALFAIDTTVVPPLRSKDIREVPKTIEKLAQSPKDQPVCFYPLAQRQEYSTLHYLYLQQFHLHPMLNGTKPSTEADLYRLALKDIYSPYTPRMLKALNIKKAVILNSYYSNKDYGNYPLGKPFNPEQMPDGYTLAVKTEDGFIYDVNAEPAGVFPLYYTNFTPPAILKDGRSWSAMTSSNGQMMFDRLSDETEYSFSITVFNPGAPGDLILKLGGKTIEKIHVENATAQLSISRIRLEKKSELLDLKWSGDTTAIDGTQFRSKNSIDVSLLFSSPELSASSTTDE